MSTDFLKHGDLNPLPKNIFNHLSDFNSSPDMNISKYLSRANKRERVLPGYNNLSDTFFGVVCAVDDGATTSKQVDTHWVALDAPQSTATTITLRVWIPEVESACIPIKLPGQSGFKAENFKEICMLPKFVGMVSTNDRTNMKVPKVGDVVAVEYNDPENPAMGGKYLGMKYIRPNTDLQSKMKADPEEFEKEKREKETATLESTKTREEPKNTFEPYNLNEHDIPADSLNVKRVEHVEGANPYKGHENISIMNYGRIARLIFRDGLMTGYPDKPIPVGKSAAAGGGYWLKAKSDGMNKELMEYYQAGALRKFKYKDDRVSRLVVNSPIFQAGRGSNRGPANVMYIHKYAELPLRMALKEIELNNLSFKINQTITDVDRRYGETHLNPTPGKPGVSRHSWAVTIDFNKKHNEMLTDTRMMNQSYVGKFKDSEGNSLVGAKDHISKNRKIIHKYYLAKKGPFSSDYTVSKEVVGIFAYYGFHWGGLWPGAQKDYMHFQYVGDPSPSLTFKAYYKGIYNAIRRHISADGKTLNVEPAKKDLRPLIFTGTKNMEEINSKVEQQLDLDFTDLHGGAFFRETII